MLVTRDDLDYDLNLELKGASKSRFSDLSLVQPKEFWANEGGEGPHREPMKFALVIPLPSKNVNVLPVSYPSQISLILPISILQKTTRTLAQFELSTLGYCNNSSQIVFEIKKNEK